MANNDPVVPIDTIPSVVQRLYALVAELEAAFPFSVDAAEIAKRVNTNTFLPTWHDESSIPSPPSASSHSRATAPHWRGWGTDQ
jgi:hypothetical protein